MSLDDRSAQRLKGVHPDLVKAVRHAAHTVGGFSVIEGLRSVERQRELLKAKKTRTMNSRHITGHAVDLLPTSDADGDGKTHFDDWDEFYALFRTMRKASIETKVPMVWGGVWDRLVSEYEDPKAEIAAYGVRQKKRTGRSAFIDGPHFELARTVYPAP